MVRLTGAVALVIMLAAGAVGAVAALLPGWFAVRAIRSATIEVGSNAATTGDETTLTMTIAAPRGPIHVRVFDRGSELADGWLVDGMFGAEVSFATRGVVDHFDVIVESAGRPGLIWWQRRLTIAIDPVVVAPRPAGPGATIEMAPANALPEAAPVSGAGLSATADIDGVRRWRDGDGHHAVHWPTSLRTGTLVVFDHRHETDQKWVVRVDPQLAGTADEADVELAAGKARWALDEGRRLGVQTWAAVGTGNPVRIDDAVSAARWSASCLPAPTPARRRRRWRRVEPVEALSRRSRWMVALTSAVGVAVLGTGVGAAPTTILAAVVGCALSAVLTTAPSTRRWSRLILRVCVVLIAVGGALAMVASVDGITNLVAVIRGPLPQMLILLVVIHGFECTNRRAARAALAFSFVVTAYAAGQRIDSALGWWLTAWAVCWLVTMATIAAPPTTPQPKQQRRRSPGVPAGPTPAGQTAARRTSAGPQSGVTRHVRSAAAVLAGAGVTVIVLAVVPVPDGSARLGLLSAFESVVPVDTAGTLAAPDGSTTRPTTTTSRTSNNTVGGYPGFDQSLDTSMRGDLGDAVVMRVRAPQPDFWRGQTFATFDGRLWYADENQGRPHPGPDIEIDQAIGDVAWPAVDTEELVQTYYVEVDQRNVVFAAYRPTRVLIDADVWARPDGALRTDVVMTEGAVYTVISERALVTADTLRAQGHVNQMVGGASPDNAYLAISPTMTERTRALADELAAGTSSTYDMVRAMEQWIGANVEYDLDAPIPADGVDAVDDLLFGSRLGFCEQIATALTMMVRSQGVPARLATGYVPGERDRVTGVWNVRASDAHAWVEVWFPLTGWQAFDPTADVPLAGDSARPTVGGDIVRAIGDAARRHGRALARFALVALVVGALVTLVARRVIVARRQRRRGRWGVLQDRWRNLAAAAGVDPMCTNPELARHWADLDPDGVGAANHLASVLDRVAFDPTWSDADEVRYADAVAQLESIERARARSG
jgi:protein-glutamine gamma-glutamyltransferase